MTLTIAIGGIVHETNTFATRPTTFDEFAVNGWYRGTEMNALRGTNTVVGGFLQAAAGDSEIALVRTTVTSAIPGGIVSREAFEAIVGEIEAGIGAQPVDAVVLDLHGAMVVDGIPAGDGEVARRIRALVDPSIPIVAVLDLHANLDQVLLDSIDVLLPYDTYPHIDCADRGAEAIRLAARMARGDNRPTTRAVKLSLSPPGPNQCSDLEPTASLQRAARAWERHDRVLNVGILFGFPYSDVPHNGMAVIATTNDDEELASHIANDIGSMVLSRYLEFVPDMHSVEEAVHSAMEESIGPVVLADYGDNPGGGTTSDGTSLLWALLDLGAGNAALAVMCDPEVVARAFDAGVGTELSVEIGGKQDQWHGSPLPVLATVRNLTDGSYVYDGPMRRGVHGSLGRTAVLGCRGRHDNVVEVVCAERRVQAFDTAIFRSQGIEPRDKSIVVVKSGVHFRGSFGPLASRIITVNTPGLMQADVTAFPFVNIQRPLWPHDDDEPRMIRMS